MRKVVTGRMVKSFLDLFVLDLLDGGAMHDYEIMPTRSGIRITASRWIYYRSTAGGLSAFWPFEK